MIDRVASSAVSNDGHHTVLSLRTQDGSEFALGIPCDLLAPLIDHCASANTESERILRTGRDLKITTSWWNSAMDRESGEFTLMLSFGKGGTLSFGLSAHMAKALLATLCMHFAGEGTSSIVENSRISSAPESLTFGFT